MVRQKQKTPKRLPANPLAALATYERMLHMKGGGVEIENNKLFGDAKEEPAPPPAPS